MNPIDEAGATPVEPTTEIERGLQGLSTLGSEEFRVMLLGESETDERTVEDEKMAARLHDYIMNLEPPQPEVGSQDLIRRFPRRRAADDGKLVIGVAGGSGAGKSYLAQELLGIIPRRWGLTTAVICLDNYYRDQSHVDPEARKARNYDVPDAFDVSLLVEHIQTLLDGRSVDMPIYNFHENNRATETRRTSPTDVIILEGTLLYAIPELLNLIDLRIYRDCDSPTRLERRVARDVKDRGRSSDGVNHQWHESVLPAHSELVEPTRSLADVIIDQAVEIDDVGPDSANAFFAHLALQTTGGQSRVRTRVEFPDGRLAIQMVEVGET